MSGLHVIQPGMMTLLTDLGRFGHHRIGLTCGGPMDPYPFMWANRLCSNDVNATALEISVGGVTLEADVNTLIAVTGADIELKINGQLCDCWQSHRIHPGDRIELGYAQQGLRAYLAICGGFDIKPQFGSTATVMREKIGGIDGDKLKRGQLLPCANNTASRPFILPQTERPRMDRLANLPLRVVLGYQQAAFSRIQKQIFFSSEYSVSNRADRMGYRLEGPQIAPSINGILSEGICLGAIQVPADGQPIVLLNDRQTIGGYPKLGAVITQDVARLAQMTPGTTLQFEPINQEDAQTLHLLQHKRFERTALKAL